MAIKMIKTKNIFDDNKTINTKSNNDNPIFNFVFNLLCEKIKTRLQQIQKNELHLAI